MGIKKTQLLPAVHCIEGVVDIERDASGHLTERRTIKIDHAPAHPQQRPHVGQILEARYGRLRARAASCLGKLVERHPEYRVMPQRRGVVAILVSGGNHQQTETDDLGERMNHPIRGSGVVQATGQTIGDAKAAFDRPERQNSSI
jgi:hypothetical protein